MSHISSISTGLELVKTAIAKAGYTDKVQIGMDVAASEFYRDGKYDLDFKNENSDPTKWVGPLYLISEIPVCRKFPDFWKFCTDGSVLKYRQH